MALACLYPWAYAFYESFSGSAKLSFSLYLYQLSWREDLALLPWDALHWHATLVALNARTLEMRFALADLLY